MPVTTKKVAEAVGRLIRTIGHGVIEREGRKGWYIDNYPLSGGYRVTYGEGGSDVGHTAERVPGRVILYAVNWAQSLIDGLIRQRVLINGTKADNAMRLALKEIEQFHSTAYPDCKPVAGVNAWELCPAHEAMYRLKEALGDVG
jgi:hypothetical protein